VYALLNPCPNNGHGKNQPGVGHSSRSPHVMQHSHTSTEFPHVQAHPGSCVVTCTHTSEKNLFIWFMKMRCSENTKHFWGLKTTSLFGTPPQIEITRKHYLAQKVTKCTLMYKLWKEFITVVLRKPGKPRYNTPKVYRPIALLNTMLYDGLNVHARVQKGRCRSS